MFSAHRSNQNFQYQSLFTHAGQRKYLNADERARFLLAAKKQRLKAQLLCELLLHSGCRISEALNLTHDCILPSEGLVLVRSLKKRNQIVVRQVPLPRDLLKRLNARHTDHSHLLWDWQRTWAWMQVRRTMQCANVVGPHSTPRGLRHGFGVHAIQCGVPLDMVQRWLGHANIATTAIYTSAVGPEERALAERMW